MTRYISLIALMALVTAPALAAEISAPPIGIPSAPGASPGGASITPPAASSSAPGGADVAAPATGGTASMSVTDLKAAAEKGNVDAEYALAEHYGQRNSLDADFGVAAEWYEKAANAGNKDAQFKLGTLYQDALGVSQNYPVAYFWVSVAAKDSTNKVWLAKRDELEKLLKPEQVASLKAKAAAWKPAGPVAGQPAAAAQ